MNSCFRSVETGEFASSDIIALRALYSNVCAGHTQQGATNWQQYGADGVYLDVSTAGCGFSETPLYFTSIGGSAGHWLGSGATAIYDPTPTGFRVYVSYPGITPTQANQWGWHLNWSAR